MSWFEKKFEDIFTNKKSDTIKEVKIETDYRKLTKNEIDLIKSVYLNKVNCNDIKIHLASFFPLNTQDEDTFVTPNNNIYIMQKHFRPDYSMEDDSYKKNFLHEIGHIWQHQKKLNVLMRAGSVQACAKFHNEDPNNYNIFDTKKYPSKIMPNLVETLPKKLVDYNLEQQAEMFSDYWLIKNKGKLRNLMTKGNYDNIKNHNINDILKIYSEKIKEALA